MLNWLTHDQTGLSELKHMLSMGYRNSPTGEVGRVLKGTYDGDVDYRGGYYRLRKQFKDALWPEQRAKLLDLLRNKERLLMRSDVTAQAH
ncbi:hypothetical protein ACWPMX_14340 [Tsuneonella sp. HG094]